MYKDRTHLFLVNPPKLQKHGGYSNFGETKKEYRTILAPNDQFTLLVVGDLNGKVVFRGDGRVPLGFVETGDAVASLRLTDDLMCMNVASTTSLVTWDMSFLQASYREISIITHHFNEISMLIGHLKQTVNEMVTQWKDATRVFQIKMGLLKPLLESYQCDLGGQHLFFTMITSGIVPPELAQFFTSNLNEQVSCSWIATPSSADTQFEGGGTNAKSI